MEKKYYKNIASGILTIFLLGFTSFNAFCTDHNWTNGGGDKKWSNASNWDVNTVPGIADKVNLIDVNDTIYIDGMDSINELYMQGNSILEILGGNGLHLDYVANFSSDGNDSPRVYVNSGSLYFGNSIGSMGGIVNCGKGNVYLQNGTGGYTVFNADSSTITFGGWRAFSNMDTFYNLVVNTQGMGLMTWMNTTIKGNLSGSGTMMSLWNTLFVTGDMTISNFQAYGSLVKFIGTSTQNINGYEFYDMEIDNNAGISMQGDFQLDDNLTFNPSGAAAGYSRPANLFLNDNVMTVNSGATFTSADETNGYIITNGQGFINMEASSSGTTFPVGTDINTYTPITLNPSTTTTFNVSTHTSITDEQGNMQTAHAMNSEWVITPTSDVSSFTATYQWPAIDELTSFDRSNMTAYYRETSFSLPWPWIQLGSMGAASGSGPYTFQIGGIALVGSTEYHFTAADKNNPLPVELITFTARPDNGKNILDWKTASEINNDHFEIQRSVDGKTWSAIGDMPGHGTTQQEEVYSYIDASANTLASNTVYYRLKQVDYNGAFVYSDIRKISPSISNNYLKLYPNPAKDMLNIFFDGNESKILKIYDMNGECIYTSSNSNLQKQIDISSFASGMYILKLYSANDVSSQVFCKE